jgi:beta-N-acetylhexosaminidase
MPTNKRTQELKKSAGQLLVIGFDGTDMSAEIRALLEQVQPAGVILFARNIVTVRQTHELLRACREYLTPSPFLCVDMEGGLVDRLKRALEPAPSPGEVFATGDRKLYRKHGRVIGDECRMTGFNVDFAPVSDLAFEASRAVLGSRAVSSEAKHAVTYIREFLRGLKDAGVLGCGKHFPGLGEGKLDSHQYLPVIKKPWKNLWDEDLVPYRVLRRAFPFVMVCHAAYPEVSGEETPASLSRKWISEVLRKKIGYRGLVISDDLEMAGVLTAGAVEDAAVGHIRAGGDLCLVCHKAERITAAYEALIREAERDSKFERRVRESAARIESVKKKSPQLRRLSLSPTPAKVEQMTRQIWEFSERVRLEALARQEQA